MALSGGLYLTAGNINRTDGASANVIEDDLLFGKYTEVITLDLEGATTDSSAGMLPANAIIDGVLATVDTAITGATGLQIGDATTAARWGTLAALTAGSSNLASAWTPWKGTISTDETGPTVGATALAVRLTATGGTPTAGKVRVTSYWRVLKIGPY